MLRHNYYIGLDKIIQYHNWRLTAELNSLTNYTLI